MTAQTIITTKNLA